MKAVVLQSRPEFGRTDANLKRAAELLSGVQADLILLPELFASGYLFEDRKELESLAENLSGSIVSTLKVMSREKKCAIVAGFAERSGEQVFNSLVLVEHGEVLALYRKMHLFAAETQLFDRSDDAFKVVEAAGSRLGLMICFDWVFPEVARSLALDGAQILCHPSNLVLPFCQKAMVTRSIENGVFTLLANRVGRETRAGHDLVFTGGSEIVSPKGELLAQAGTEEEEVLQAEFDPKQADNKWITKYNHLFGDRRPSSYSRLVEEGEKG